MFQLIYKSITAPGVSIDVFKRIVEESSIRNRRENISGILMIHDRSIMQIFEGEKVAVRNLFDKIAADPRHQDAHVILTRTATQREFGHLGMRLCEVDGYGASRFRMTVSALQARQRRRIRGEARAMIAEFAQIGKISA